MCVCICICICIYIYIYIYYIYIYIYIYTLGYIKLGRAMLFSIYVHELKQTTSGL